MIWIITYRFSEQGGDKFLTVEASNRPLAVRQLKLHLSETAWNHCIIIDCEKVI